jgi:imidazolonepropionase-like amidohydrolase
MVISMRFLPFFLLATVISCAPPAYSTEVTAFVGVNVVPMDEERVLLGQSVVVSDGVISAIGPVDEVEIPAGARVIQGRGRWLLPGLIDMHVHLRAADLPRYVENGITTVRDLASMDAVMQVAGAVGRGELVGPRIIVSSRLLSAPNAQNPPFSVVVTPQANIQQIVDAELARGAGSIKVWADLAPAAYDAVIAAARARGVKVVGHVPASIDIHHAIASQNEIEHLSGYPLGDPDRNRRMAEESRGAGVWNCPTMVVYSQWVTRDLPPDARQRLLQDRRELVAALHDAGARLLAGTDCGYYVPAGTSMHDELDELIAAGLTPFEALSAATRSAAEFLEDPSIGTIHTGARADLVLVAQNPLETPSTLRAPRGVMLSGRWLSYERRRAVR